MASKAVKSLGVFKRRTKFDKGIGACLPQAYRKFYNEWMDKEPTAVHYIPEEGVYKRDEVTGEVRPIQNVPIPLKYPKEFDEQLWGGEAVVKGFQKRDPQSRRVPHFWFPLLKRSVVYSEVLDKYMSVIITNRTLKLIHTHYGFDHYLLKTPACDLRSLLPLGLKRKILQELQAGCPSYASNPEKQKEVLDKYRQYLSAYTPEEIEWYGYSFEQACKKYENIVKANTPDPVPLKHLYRSELIQKLKEAQIKEAQVDEVVETSWLQRMNPFGKNKKET